MIALKDKYRVNEMAGYLNVTRGGFYGCMRRGVSAKEREDAAFKVRIRNIFEGSGRTYGAIRIAKDLQDEGACEKILTFWLFTCIVSRYNRNY